MQYSEACGEKLSRLGFGCMRLPLTEEKAIDEAELQRMVDYAIAHGVNYFDTAYPYHGGMSEICIGKALARHPRGEWFLADKYPGHQIASSYHPEEIFEEQLKKCGVEYFDFYLLHNVYENSIGVYTDPRWGILDYFKEQKRLGRIRHLGFSSHARPDTLKRFLDDAGDSMEFCQIQLNYLDWSLQDAKTKYELLTERGIPVWVMEPLRGGRLAALPEDEGDAPGRKHCQLGFPLAAAAAQCKNGPVRHVIAGTDGRQRGHLLQRGSPERGGIRAGGGNRGGPEERTALHPVPLLLRRLPHGAGYPDADSCL